MSEILKGLAIVIAFVYVFIQINSLQSTMTEQRSIIDKMTENQEEQEKMFNVLTEQLNSIQPVFVQAEQPVFVEPEENSVRKAFQERTEATEEIIKFLGCESGKWEVDSESCNKVTCDKGFCTTTLMQCFRCVD